MKHFYPIYTQLANENVLYTNDHFHSSSFHAIYNQFYLDRPIIPTIHLSPVDFDKYDLHPNCLIANLGWSSLVLPRPSTCYPDAVTSFTLTFGLKETSMKEGDLPFGSAISALIQRLGIHLHLRFTAAGYLPDICPQHVLRCIGWSGYLPLNSSRGEGPMDADDLAAETERRLHI
ncbi:hypothetical protein LINPERPRIM_LOCUS23641 [Linum perenne]